MAITFTFAIAEAPPAISHSLALVSDAGQFRGALALFFAWSLASLRPNGTRSAITAGDTALVNAVSLVVIALLIFWEAAGRLGNPGTIHSTPMIIVALIAIVMNTAISLWLRGDAAHDLNVRSAYLHMVGDAVSAAGVVVAGVVVTFTQSSIADSIVSILIGVLILWSSWGILQESVNVLLESIPKGMDMDLVEQTIAGVPGVLAVHDLHVWTIGSGIIACSCHITVGEQSIRFGQDVLRAVNEELKHHFGISHSTIQVEVEGCDPDDMYCIARATRHEPALKHRH